MSMITLNTSTHSVAASRPAQNERKSAFDERVSAMREQVLTIWVLGTIAATAITLKAYMF